MEALHSSLLPLIKQGSSKRKATEEAQHNLVVELRRQTDMQAGAVRASVYSMKCQDAKNRASAIATLTASIGACSKSLDEIEQDPNFDLDYPSRYYKSQLSALHLLEKELDELQKNSTNVASSSLDVVSIPRTPSEMGGHSTSSVSDFTATPSS
jgi:hypothetical protein